jgi:pyruvate/2-oxoglutarate dehydrogenase complex dihydrolipoamide dehydrogenase (E3) component
VTTVRGYGHFVGTNHVEVEETTGTGQEKTGTKKVVAFKRAIIAAGSQAVRLPFMPEDPRVVDSTGALALKEVPKRMLILGGGIIGLEMGTVYSTLGARLDVVEMLDGLMQGADRDLVKIWQKMNAKRFDHIMLKTKTVGAKATPEGIEVTFAPAEEGGTAPAPQTYDLVLQAVGRTPNGKKIAAEKAGVAVTERGFINVDIQMRTNVPHIFAIGDIVGQPMLAHKAVHEAHVAAEVIAGELQGNKELASAAFNARVIPSVAYTDPEVAWVGLTEDQAKAQGIKVKKGMFPWTASGRAIANGRDEGVTKLLFDDSPEAHGHGKILGGRHGRHPCGRHDRRGGAGHRDGRRRGGHRQDDSSASHAGREHRHGGGSGAWQLHGCAAGAEISAAPQAHPPPRWPATSLTGRSALCGSGRVLQVQPDFIAPHEPWRDGRVVARIHELPGGDQLGRAQCSLQPDQVIVGVGIRAVPGIAEHRHASRRDDPKGPLPGFGGPKVYFVAARALYSAIDLARSAYSSLVLLPQMASSWTRCFCASAGFLSIR